MKGRRGGRTGLYNVGHHLDTRVLQLSRTLWRESGVGRGGGGTRTAAKKETEDVKGKNTIYHDSTKDPFLFAKIAE